jgi:hypothetical protein
MIQSLSHRLAWVVSTLALWLLADPRCHAGNPTDFQVPRGQLTFDAEGTEGGKYHSRKPHVPSDNSGLTIGRGYDMKEREAEQVSRHLQQAGLMAEDAKAYAKGAGLSGAAARDFIKKNKLVEITPAQQKALFQISYEEIEADAKRISNKGDVVKLYGKTDWDKLHPAIKDLVVDLRFRGDYTPATRKLIQKAVAGNDLPAVAAVISEARHWKGGPDDRFRRRRDYARAALKKE